MEFCKATLTFKSADEILWCDHSNESYWAVLSCGTVYYVVQGSSNFWVCGWNPVMWPFKWKLSVCTFTWCYLFSKSHKMKFRNLVEIFFWLIYIIYFNIFLQSCRFLATILNFVQWNSIEAMSHSGCCPRRGYSAQKGNFVEYLPPGTFATCWWRTVKSFTNVK